MSGSGEVLQEYLIKLGYTVDQISLGRFNAGISSSTANVLKVGGAVFGVVASVEAATAAFAYSMRKMYFQSQLSGASVKNLQSLSFASKQVGLDSNAMGDAIGHMSRMIRTNPGTQALIEAFGVKVTGRDASDVAKDMLGTLKQMPEFIGAQWANQLFGMDADSFHLAITNIDKLNAKQAEAKAIFEQMGMDPDKASAALTKYADTMDVLGLKLKTLGAVMLTEFAPEFEAMNEMVSGAISWWADWARGINHVSDLFKNMDIPSISKLLKEAYGQSDADKTAGKPKSFSEWLFSSPADSAAGAKPTTPNKTRYSAGSVTDATKAPTQAFPTSVAGAGRGGGGVAAPAAGAGELFTGLERKYNLPSGLLDNVWSAESARGKHMTSKVGAQGHFQFMPKTKAEFGLKDPNNLEESADAASRKMRGLLQHYSNDLEKAVAGYNWGEGNLDTVLKKHGNDWKAHLPAETSAYIGKVVGGDTKLGSATTGGTFNQTNNMTITIADAGNPRATASAVGDEMKRVNQDTLRNGGGMVR